MSRYIYCLITLVIISLATYANTPYFIYGADGHIRTSYIESTDSLKLVTSEGAINQLALYSDGEYEIIDSFDSLLFTIPQRYSDYHAVQYEDLSWNYGVYKNDSNVILVKENEDGILSKIKVVNEGSCLDITYCDGFICGIEGDSLHAVLSWGNDSLYLVLQYSDTIISQSYCTTFISSSKFAIFKPRRVSDRSVLQLLYGQLRGALNGEVGNIITDKFGELGRQINNGFSNFMKFKDLVDLLRETDGYNALEMAEYLEQKYGWGATGGHYHDPVPATIIWTINTGAAKSITDASAICSVDGYLSCIANDGVYDVNYGICYSTFKNVTMLDNQVYGTTNAINVSLPAYFTLRDLSPNTKYYYRAFAKDLNSSNVEYGNISSFTTTVEYSVVGDWTCIGYSSTPEKAYLKRMVCGENGSLVMTYYYTSNGQTKTHNNTYTYDNASKSFVMYKSNGDIQYWTVTELDDHKLTLVSNLDGFKYYFSK